MTRMTLLGATLLGGFGLTSLMPVSSRAQRSTVTHFDIARSWAPCVLQDTDDDDLQDFITRWDYDNSDPRDNWENLQYALLTAHMYYAVVETSDHYYVSYFFYHPRDWTVLAKPSDSEPAPTRICPLTHEHDFEGVTLVIRKPAEADADLMFMYTQAHGDAYYFTNDPTITLPDALGEACGSRDHLDNLYGNRHCNPLTDVEDRRLCFWDAGAGLHRPVVFIETGGHGIGTIARAMTPSTTGIALDCGTYLFYGGDGVMYVPSPSNEAGLPPPPGNEAVQAEYKLLSLEDEVWRRHRRRHLLLRPHHARRAPATQHGPRQVIGRSARRRAIRTAPIRRTASRSDGWARAVPCWRNGTGRPARAPRDSPA